MAKNKFSTKQHLTMDKFRPLFDLIYLKFYVLKQWFPISLITLLLAETTEFNKKELYSKNNKKTL